MDMYTEGFVALGGAIAQNKDLIKPIFDAAYFALTEGVIKPFSQKRMNRIEHENQREILKISREEFSEKLEKTRLFQGLSTEEQNTFIMLNFPEIRSKIAFGSILYKAGKYLDEDKAYNIPLDDIHFIYDKCKHVTDHNLQELWASLLAQKAKGNIGIPKRLAQTLSLLEYEEMKLVELLLNHSAYDTLENEFITFVEVTERSVVNVVPNVLSYSDLNRLNDIGIIKFRGTEIVYTRETPSNLCLEYGEKKILGVVNEIYAKNRRSNTVISIGNVSLTTTGHEIAKLYKPQTVDKRAEEIFEFLERYNKNSYSFTIMDIN